YAETEYRGRHGGPPRFGKAPVLDVVRQRRREVLGRMEKRDDRSLGRVTTDAQPGGEIVKQQQDDRADGQKRFPLIGNSLQNRFGPFWISYDALLKRNREAHPFPRAKSPLGLERRDIVAFSRDRHRSFGRPGHTRICRHISDYCTWGQGHPRARPKNWEVPVIAGGIPVEFITIGAWPGHALHGVGNRISVFAPRQQHVRIAYPDALKIPHALDTEL